MAGTTTPIQNLAPASTPLSATNVLAVGQGASASRKVTLAQLLAWLMSNMPPVRNGVDGNTVRYGDGPPAPEFGNDGDFYISSGLTFYGPKALGQWPAGRALAANVLSGPTNTVAPSISGPALEGETLTGVVGTWTGGPGFTEQWYRGATAIPGATGLTYVLVAADIGQNITMKVTGTNAADTLTVASNAIGPIAAADPVNTSAPVIAGTPEEGQTLSVSDPGDWTNAPTEFDYQWQLNGADIAGANAETYTAGAADLGGQLKCVITAINPFGSGTAASNQLGPVASGQPTNTSAPVITGTATQNNSLTLVDEGIWTRGPTLTAQWRRNGVAIPGENALTYLLVAADVGTTIDCLVTGTNVWGTATAASNGKGPIAAAAGLSSTNATLTTAAGQAPEVDLTFGPDIYPGFYLHIQRTATGAGAAGDYTTPTLDVMHPITDDERAAQDVPNSALAFDGYVDPTGAFWQRYRWEREDGVVGPWTEISGNVTASVATWSPTTGANKSQYLTISNSNFTLTCNASTGANNGARSSVGKTGKGHFEVSFDAHGSADTNGSFLIGVTDDAFAVGPAVFNAPGSAAGRPGAAWRFKFGNVAGTLFRNGANVASANLAVALADADKFAVEFDPTGATVSLYHCPISTGVWYLVQTITLTSQIPAAAWYSYGGGLYAGDKLTGNWGASPFSMLPTAGYSGW